MKDKPDQNEAITVKLEDGRTIYWPPGNMARLAPAAVCALASRTLRARERLRKMPVIDRTPFDVPEVRRFLEDLLAPLPFEAQLLSGQIEQVHDALETFGQITIIAVVENGVLQDVHCSNHDAELFVYDLDNLQEQGVPSYDIEGVLKEATETMKIIPQYEMNAEDFQKDETDPANPGA